MTAQQQLDMVNKEIALFKNNNPNTEFIVRIGNGVVICEAK